MKSRFTIWGTEVCSDPGTVEGPVEKRVQLMLLIFLVLSLSCVTKCLMQRVLGSLVHPFSHRKECACILGRVYVWVDRMPDDVGTKIPHDIADELRIAQLGMGQRCTASISTA